MADDLLTAAQKQIDDAAKQVGGSDPPPPPPAPSAPADTAEETKESPAELKAPDILPPGTDTSSVTTPPSQPQVAQVESSSEEQKTELVDAILNNADPAPTSSQPDVSVPPPESSPTPPADQAVSTSHPPPAQTPDKPKSHKVPILMTLFLLMSSIFLIGIYVQRQRELADVRSKAADFLCREECVQADAPPVVCNVLPLCRQLKESAQPGVKNSPTPIKNTETGTTTKKALEETEEDVKDRSNDSDCSPGYRYGARSIDAAQEACIGHCKKGATLDDYKTLDCTKFGGEVKAERGGAFCYKCKGETKPPSGGNTPTPTKPPAGKCSSESECANPGDTCGGNKVCKKTEKNGSDGKPICNCRPDQEEEPGQCRNIKVYRDGNRVTDLTSLRPGDRVVLAVVGTNATKGRFRVNGAPAGFAESTGSNSNGEFTLAFTIPNATQITIEAEIFTEGRWK